MDNKIRLILATLLTLCIFSPGSIFLQVAQASEGSISGNVRQTAQPNDAPNEEPGLGIVASIGTLIACFFFVTVYRKAKVK